MCHTRSLAEAKDLLDILIELGERIGATQTAYLKARGAKFVSCRCRVECINTTESIPFGRRLWDSLFIDRAYNDG